MRLPKVHQDRFPTFSKYVKTKIPLFRTDREIVDTIHDLVELPKPAIKNAMMWGTQPVIKVARDLRCARHAGFGCFRNVAPDTIEIEERLVQLFEDQVYVTTRGTQQSKVVQVGITLLHELVHWADYRVNKRHTRVISIYKDVGDKWEKLTFSKGKLLPH